MWSLRIQVKFVPLAENTRIWDEDEKGLNQIQPPGGKQKMTVVNESGYGLNTLWARGLGHSILLCGADSAFSLNRL